MGKMRRVMLIVAVAIAAIILLATIICNSGYVQNRLISMATDALEKELNTEVQIEGIGINLLGQHVTAYGVSLKDQQQRDLVRVKEIFGDFRLLPLLSGHVALKECRLSGIDLLIIKPEDGPANYQFLLDSAKKGNKGIKKRRSNPTTKSSNSPCNMLRLNNCTSGIMIRITIWLRRPIATGATIDTWKSRA